MSAYSFSHQDIDKVSYEFFTEKSLQYFTQQTESSAEALKRILEYLKTASAFCKGESEVEVSDGLDIKFFTLFSQAMSPQGSLEEFGNILAEYSYKIEALLAGDYTHKESVKEFLLSLRDTIEQQLLLESDNKTRWRL